MDLRTDSIGFAVDASDREYAFIKTTLLSKNVKASLNSKEFEDLKCARIYADGTGACPLQAMKDYLEHTYQNSLFPKPTKTGFSTAAVLG